MSKVYSTNEVINLPPDSPVPCFKGKLVSLWPAKSGQNERGDWSFQNGEVKDGLGKTIRFTLKDRAALKAPNGAEIVFICHSGNRGLTGVKAKDDEYKGKSQRVLWVTSTAEVLINGRPDGNPDASHETGQERSEGPGQGDDNVPMGDEPDNGGARAHGTQDSSQHEQQQNEPREKKDYPVAEAKIYLARCANLMILIRRAAAFVEENSKALVETSPDSFQALCATFWINITKETNLLDRMPVKPIVDTDVAAEPGETREEEERTTRQTKQQKAPAKGKGKR